MSFDVHLICVRDGKGATFPRELFEEIMGRGAIDPDFPLWAVTYADGGSQIIGADEENLDGAMFNHFGGDTFFDRLWELADRTNSFFWWPNTHRSVAITRRDIISHIPDGALDGLGEPYFVQTGKELENAIYRGIDRNQPRTPTG